MCYIGTKHEVAMVKVVTRRVAHRQQCDEDDANDDG